MSSAKPWKGILLAGGSGTRLHPITLGMSKQLLPVYDKPMIYYPLSVLMLAGVRSIALISTPRDLPFYQHLLGDGRQWGVSFHYVEQARPEGIAQAFLLTEDFMPDSPTCMVLGDNIFFGHGLDNLLASGKKTVEQQGGATVFGYHVSDPQRYGVVEFDAQGKALNIEEKPAKPRSSYAVTGLYFYDNTVLQRAKLQKPSPRGELEITDINNSYLNEGSLKVEKLGRGIAWLDTGTHDSLLSAATFVQAVQNRQGLKVACLEEIAWRQNFIDRQQLLHLGEQLKNSAYGQYLVDIAQEGCPA